MQKFTTLTGIAAPLPIMNVDTDMIIPKDYLKTIQRTGLGKGLFAEMRYNEDGSENPDFVLSWDAVVADDYSSVSWSGHGEVAKGMLILRATEAAQKEPFWMAADSAGLTGRITPDKAWKKVEPAVRRMLARFPPPPAG